MKQTTYYTYLGDKGTVTTFLQIPGAFSIKKVMLVADKGKVLTKDNKFFTTSVLVPESEVELWKEVEE